MIGRIVCAMVVAVLAVPAVATMRQARLSPAEIATLAKGRAGPGTSGVAGIRTTTLYGELQRRMYKRSGTIATEVAASHAVYISQPTAVAAVIEKAAKHSD